MEMNSKLLSKSITLCKCGAPVKWNFQGTEETLSHQNNLG